STEQGELVQVAVGVDMGDGDSELPHRADLCGDLSLDVLWAQAARERLQPYSASPEQPTVLVNEAGHLCRFREGPLRAVADEGEVHAEAELGVSKRELDRAAGRRHRRHDGRACEGAPLEALDRRVG